MHNSESLVVDWLAGINYPEETYVEIMQTPGWLVDLNPGPSGMDGCPSL